MNLQHNRPAGETAMNSRLGSSGVDGRPRVRLRPVLVALEDRTLLSTFTVDNTLDDALPTVGTLRWAVGEANSNPGADTIDFDASVFSSPQTVTLTAGELTLTDFGAANATTITGPAA